MSDSARDLSACSLAELLERFAAISQEIETVDHVWRVNRLHDTRRRVVAAIKDLCEQLEPNTSDRVLRELALRKDEIGRTAAALLERRETLSRKTPSAPAKAVPLSPVPSPGDSHLSRHEAPTGMSRAELEPLVFEAFPRETASALMALARPAIRLWAQPLGRASDLGSRFGGLPIVSKNWEWPTTEVWPKSAGLEFLNKSPAERGPMPQEPKWFLGQINCADLRGLHTAEDLLPPAGVFSFFGDGDLVTGCMGSWETGNLYFFSGDHLKRAAEPIEDFKTLPTCGLAFSEAIDLPDPFSRAIEHLALDKPLWDRYFDLREKVSKHGVEVERYGTLDHSKLFGWPDLIQRDLEAFADEDDAKERLLLQIGNYDNGIERWSWGPGGLVYFALSETAFNQGDCDACRCEMQCT